MKREAVFDRHVVRAHLRHRLRKLVPIVVSIMLSVQYWILIFQPCETAQRVRQLSSSALRGPNIPKKKYSFVNFSKNAGSCKIVVRQIELLPETTKTPPSIALVLLIPKL